MIELGLDSARRPTYYYIGLTKLLTTITHNLTEFYNEISVNLTKDLFFYK